MDTVKQEIAKNLLFYRKQSRMTQKELAEKLGVKHNAISSWESGTNSIDIDLLFRVCEVFGVSINDMYGPYADKDSLFPSERQLIKKYRALDAHGKRMIDFALDEETARMAEAESKKAPATKTIPLFGNSFAAGFGEPDFGNAWENYEVPSDSAADFAIRVNGDSMEPYLPDGSIALGRKQTPCDGDVAALLLDGEFLVKQVCQDCYDNLYLFSLNRSRSDADVTIMHDSGRTVTCFGTIIMKERVPLP